MKNGLKKYLAKIGSKGGKASRRKITPEQQAKMQEARMDAKWKAWEAGEAAHARGLTLNDNPYEGINDKQALEWGHGWMSADNPKQNVSDQ